MKILVMIHVESEGPGTLGTFLESVGAQLVTTRLYASEPLPANAGEFDAVLSMGGPMNVYQEDAYPFLKQETAFLQDAVSADVPVLGVCLGAQMIAKACGARVDLAAAREVGWREITLTRVGLKDPLFHGLPEHLTVFQWHEDVFDIPRGAALLASSTICPTQAFRFRNALGLQFHVEVTADILTEWFADSGKADLPDLLRFYHTIKETLDHNAHQIYQNFLELIRSGK